MVRIEMMDGIPCIILDDGIIWSEEKLKQESKQLIMPEIFSEFQETKEKNYYYRVLEELKKKFGEK